MVICLLWDKQKKMELSWMRGGEEKKKKKWKWWGRGSAGASGKRKR